MSDAYIPMPGNPKSFAVLGVDAPACQSQIARRLSLRDVQRSACQIKWSKSSEEGLGYSCDLYFLDCSGSGRGR